MTALIEFWVEMHFDTVIEDATHGWEEIGVIPMRSSDGSIIGSGKILAVKHPAPNVVRLMVDPDDLVIPGLT